MPSGVYVDVTIAGADDVVAPVDPDDNGKALVRNSSTGKYEHVTMSGGGGVSLDVANTWTKNQTFTPDIADVESDLSSVLVDPTFPDLTNWMDDASGWNVVSGGITHTPGAEGYLQQTVSINNYHVYFGKIVISGMTTGSAEIFDDYNLDLIVTADGTWRTAARVGGGASNNFYIYVSSDFDGKIESVEFAQIVSNTFPAAVTIKDFEGNIVGSITGAENAVTVQSGTEITLEAQRVNLDANLLPGSYSSSHPNQIWLNRGFLFVGDPANIPTSDPGPGGGIWVDGGALKLA